MEDSAKWGPLAFAGQVAGDPRLVRGGSGGGKFHSQAGLLSQAKRRTEEDTS